MVDEHEYGYILRVNTDNYFSQIFEMEKYYTGVIRNWRPGSIILLMKKVKVDSFVAYGIVTKVQMLWEMTPEEEHYCKENGWKQALTLSPLIKFENPLPKKVSAIADDKRRGYFLHGAQIPIDIVNAILEKAENYPPPETFP